MKVKDVVKAECVDLNHQGLGVCKKDGFLFFVPDLLVGESGLIEITKVSKSYGQGTLLKRFNDSQERVEAICPVFGICGGCQIMHLNNQSQLAYKQKMAEETFKRIGHFELKVKSIIGMEEPFYYRNKVQVPFRQSRGKAEYGFFKKNTHEIVPFTTCYIQPKLANALLERIKDLINSYQVEAYDEVTHTGILRHVLIRKTIADDYMVVFVTKVQDFPHLKEIIEKLVEEFPVIKSVIQNFNPKIGNVILGEKSIVWYGTKTIIDQLTGLSFQISDKSFFQTNHLQTEALYRVIEKYVDPQAKDVIVDAYSGVGTISLMLARSSKQVYGIEVVEAAVSDARNNAKLNKINNVEFITGKAEEVINKINLEIDTIVVDPPRKGCEESLLEEIIKKKIQKLVYVSCDLATLARDLKFLRSAYNIKEVTLVDMFPQTSGVETIVLLKLKKQEIEQ
ncbi:MAG: 23S rRNA (uracil(1939)-C(5))-methyltransferase RlmD [Bacilli bacterium]|nr:23S rRNA (uracil(1939)-C(5))-methyltransferase RlmD [Bacilli bacterium]